MLEESEQPRLEEFYGEDFVDVTDRVKCYEKGKTFSCDCGQGIGVALSVTSVKCASCGSSCIDKDAEDRKPPEREDDQSSLMQFT